MQVSVILLAAGLGQRMGAAVNKIWLPLAGKPLLQYSLEFFARASQVSQIIAVAHAGELEQIERLIAELPAELQGKAGLVVEGGSTRLRSVAAALPPPVLCLARRIGRPFWPPPPGRIIWGRFWRPQLLTPSSFCQRLLPRRSLAGCWARLRAARRESCFGGL